MVFYFLKLKKNRKYLAFLALLLTHFACQNLSQKKASFYNPKNKASIIIDKNYLNLQADLNYLKAETAFFESDTAKALSYLKKSQLFAPQFTHFQKRMAEIYEKEGFFSEAINKYKELTQKAPNKTSLRVKLTDLYALQQFHNKALEQNDLLLKQAPNSFPLIFKKAILLINQEDWKSALITLKTAETKAVELEETIQTLLFRAYVFTKLQKIEKSLETIKQIKKLDFPEEALSLKIADFYKNFNRETAKLYLEDFQKEKGLTPATSKALLKQALSSKNWKKAMIYIQQLEDLGQLEEQHYFYIALFHIKENRYKTAILYLKDLTAQNPQSGYYKYLLAKSYEKSQQWPKAIKTYQKIPFYSPYFLTAHLQLADLWKQQGQYKKSLKLLDHLAFNKPTSPQAALLYAETLWDAGDKKQALNTLTKALKYHPDHLDILFLRGFYFKLSGSINLALEDMKQILTIQSNHKPALKLIASLHSENN